MTIGEATATVDAVVLVDQDGGHYVLDRAVWDAARVPAEGVTELQRALADKNDVAGYITPIPIPGAQTLQVLGTLQLSTAVRSALGFDPGGGIRPAGLEGGGGLGIR
jgi:hypothetical protein